MRFKYHLSKLISIIIVISFIANLFTLIKIYAQESVGGILDTLHHAGLEAGYNTPSGGAVSDWLDTIVGQIITVVLGFLGVIFLILIIYSGFQWMTAGGNEETITKAKKRLTNAVIGLVIVMAGYIISYFVITQLYNITAGPGGPQGGSQPPG